MSFPTEYVALFLLAAVFFAFTLITKWRPFVPHLALAESHLSPLTSLLFAEPNNNGKDTNQNANIQAIATLADCHETAAVFTELIRKDGAGAWPPRCNYIASSWPASLRPYMDIYHEMKALLPVAEPSLDKVENRLKIAAFRIRHGKLLDERINLTDVMSLLQAASSGRWDIFPRDVYNAFYCCVAWHRHAYRCFPLPLSVRPTGPYFP